MTKTWIPDPTGKADMVAVELPNAVQDITDDDAITFKVRNARLIAAFFLDFLESDPDSFYPNKVRICRFDERGEEWRPIQTGHSQVVDDFIEWCQQGD